MKKILVLFSSFILIMVLTSATLYASSNTETFEDKNLVVLGDSISFGEGTSAIENRFGDILASSLNFGEYTNYGVSGSRIAPKVGDTNSFIERYNSMDANATHVIVFGGFNDFMSGSALLGVPEDDTDATFYGALNVLMTGLKTKYPSAEITFLTPYNFTVDPVDSKVAHPVNALTIDIVSDAIMRQAAVHKIDAIDLRVHLGLDLYSNADDIDLYTSEGLHLTDLGNKHLSNLLISYYQRRSVDYFDTNMLDFETVTVGKNISYDGTIIDSATRQISDFIPVEEGKSYIIYGQQLSDGTPLSTFAVYYDENQEFVESAPSGRFKNEVVKIPTGIKYIRINMTITEARLDETYVRELINYPGYLVKFVTDTYFDYPAVFVPADTTLNVQNPVKSNFVFSGWYTDPQLTDYFAPTDTVNQELVLYAKWSTGTGLPDGGVATPVVSETTSFLGIAWYWWLGGIAVAYFGFTKKGRKALGFKK